MTCGYDEQQAKRRGNQRMRVHGIMWAVMVLVHWVGDLTITTFLHYYLEHRCSRSNEPEPKQECGGRAPRLIRFVHLRCSINQGGQASFCTKTQHFVFQDWTEFVAAWSLKYFSLKSYPSTIALPSIASSMIGTESLDIVMKMLVRILRGKYWGMYRSWESHHWTMYPDDLQDCRQGQRAKAI